MCGIGGILRTDGGLVEPRPLERMNHALAHRGPDGSGIYVDGAIGLCHRRLSILDPTPAGAQPMLRGRNALVHNGEIYNYLELAAELRDHGERIETGTDTEVILAAYRVWGVDAVARFNGMFAFALWDAERRRVLLARDRMGVKPLYLRRTARSLAFASEPWALLQGRPVEPGDLWSPEPHLGAVHDFLSRGWTDHSAATFLEGVIALPAAHLLIVEAGTERLVRYWGPPQLADDDRPATRGTDHDRDEKLVEEFRSTYDSSVRLRLRSDVPIGTCLSGGLDSSSIVATVAELIDVGGTNHEQVPRLGFHARFPDHGIDESAFAELVARQAGIRLVHTTPAGYPLLSTVLPVLRAQGQPYGGGSINAQYAVMAAARGEGIKVLLDGQGADELLGGYLHYLGLRSAGLVFSGSPVDAASELRAQVRRGPLSAASVLWAAAHGGLPRGALETIRDQSRGFFGIRCRGALRGASAAEETKREPGTFLASRLWHALSTNGLPTLLRYEDRNSMAFGIEARVPFLDVRLIELAVRLPDRLRIDRGVTKVILRRAMNGRLPEEVATRRDKLGFAAPQRAWLADGRSEVAALLRGGQVVQRGWVAPREVERVLGGGLSGGRRTEQLWRLFILEAWLRMLWPGAGGEAGSETWEAGLAGAGPGMPTIAATADRHPGNL
jgi:asparagine synthase (glutamine-hydrolysing)